LIGGLSLIRLQPNPFIGFILNPFGLYSKKFEYRNNELFVFSRHSWKIHLKDIASIPLVIHGLLGSELTINCDDGHCASLKGANRRNAIAFAKDLEADWISHNTELFEKNRKTINAILGVIAELASPTKYPSACLLHLQLEQA